MRVLEKLVVCLALLLAALARPLPALAVWGDNNEPMPVVLGLTLGGDIREHPELWQYNMGLFFFPENWAKGATYEGIPVHPWCYNTFDYKISSVSFFIKVKDFPRFRKLMRRKFGNEILRGEDRGYILAPGYYWGKYEMEVWAQYPFEEDMVSMSFSYLPLRGQDNVHHFGALRTFTYHGVTLGRKVEDYPFLHLIKEDVPDIVYYQSDEPSLVFDGYEATYVESETWLAYDDAIYSLELRGDKSDSHFMDRELINIYEPGRDDTAMHLSPELRLGDYTIYFKGPGLTVITYMPTYWNMLRARTKLGK